MSELQRRPFDHLSRRCKRCRDTKSVQGGRINKFGFTCKECKDKHGDKLRQKYHNDVVEAKPVVEQKTEVQP